MRACCADGEYFLTETREQDRLIINVAEQWLAFRQCVQVNACTQIGSTQFGCRSHAMPFT